MCPAFKLAPGAAETPVIHYHGAIDPTVRIEWARQSAVQLRELGVCEYEVRKAAEPTLPRCHHTRPLGLLSTDGGV